MNFSLNSKPIITYRPSSHLLLNKKAPNTNYVDYRCIEPTAISTSGPWFPISNSCPCDPKLSNPTGRGFVSCPFGIQTNETLNMSITTEQQNFSGIPEKELESKQQGSLYPEISIYPVTAVPQFQPRPLAQIGYTWRSAN